MNRTLAVIGRLLAITGCVIAMDAPARPASGPVPNPAQFAALQAADVRLASIGYRLLTANAALCRDLQPEIGASLQALDQYGVATRAAADEAFGFETLIEVEGVVPGGPAARSGVVAGDSLVAVQGVALPGKQVPMASEGTPASRIVAEDRIAGLPTTAPFDLTLRHSGHDRRVTVQPVPGCRTSVELVLDDGWAADSNGQHIRIGGNYLDRFDDEELAVVMAHELGHAVLRHRLRLAAAGVNHGMFAGMGRNGQLVRQTEDEADAISVTLLYNAGYDPMAAYRFWSKPRLPDGGLFRSGTHRSAAARAEQVRAAALAIPKGASKPLIPASLELRDQPLR